MASRKRKTKVNKQVSGLTFERAREIVIGIKKVEGKADNTIESYHKIFNDFERYFTHRKLMSNVTTEDARNFIQWQLEEKIQFLNARFRTNKKKGVSITTANSYLRLAKAAYETLIQDDVLEINPFSSMTSIKQQTKQIDVLTIEQIKTLFNAFDKTWYADYRDYVLCNVLLDSFGRIDEVCNLKKSDVDYINGLATFNETKNGRYRHVPLSRKVISLIENLNYETSDFTSEFIFISNHGTRLRPDAFRKHLREVVQRTNIKLRVYPHLFRHSASTLFIANGGSVRALQKILGHAQIETTMIYSHMLDSTIKEQHEKFNPLQMINESRQIKTRTLK